MSQPDGASDEPPRGGTGAEERRRGADRGVAAPEARPATPPRGTKIRGTRQAAALAAALENLPGFCSAQQIHAELRRRGEHIGLTTVYRHLQVLSEDGSVDAIRDDSGETLYRQCGTSAHHHHLTCRNCGRSVEVEGRAVEQWAERVARDAGFTDVGHTVELFGLCPDCAVLATGRPGVPGQMGNAISGRGAEAAVCHEPPGRCRRSFTPARSQR